MSILKRTVFVDNRDGRLMFWDWAQVMTSIGSMAEPFLPGGRWNVNQDFEDFDPDDEINRIDEIRALPIDKEQIILSSDYSMGGTGSPRIGR